MLVKRRLFYSMSTPISVNCSRHPEDYKRSGSCPGFFQLVNAITETEENG